MNTTNNTTSAADNTNNNADITTTRATALPQAAAARQAAQPLRQPPVAKPGPARAPRLAAGLASVFITTTLFFSVMGGFHQQAEEAVQLAQAGELSTRVAVSAAGSATMKAPV